MQVIPIRKEGRTNDPESLTKSKVTLMDKQKIAGLVDNPLIPSFGQPNICTNPFCQICHGIGDKDNRT